MEINLSPSLSIESPIDMSIKSALISDLFTLVGIVQYERKEPIVTAKQNAQLFGLLPPEKRHMLDHISPLKRNLIFDAIKEYYRKGNFLRIYPSRNTNYYDRFFENPKATNKLLFDALYGKYLKEVIASPLDNLQMCMDIIENKEIRYNQSSFKSNNLSTIDNGSGALESFNEEMPTQWYFEDVLLVYLQRLLKVTDNLSLDIMIPLWIEKLEKFIYSPKWELEISKHSCSLSDAVQHRLKNLRDMKVYHIKSAPITDSISIYQLEKYDTQSIESFLRKDSELDIYSFIGTIVPKACLGLLSRIELLVTSSSPLKRKISTETKIRPINLKCSHPTTSKLCSDYNSRAIRYDFKIKQNYSLKRVNSKQRNHNYMLHTIFTLSANKKNPINECS
jgi:hypothetical protein